MKKRNVFHILLLLALNFGTFMSYSGQDALEPVSWTIEVISENSDTTTLVAKATIAEGWHVYSQVISDDPEAMGPMPLEIIFIPSEAFTLIGNPIEKSKMITHFDKAFGLDLNYYEDKLEIEQRIKTQSKNTTINGSISYMACDDEKCIFPPEFVFEIKITE